jgi:Rab-like protein 2
MASEPARAADIKIILLGDSAVGKSKLVERFLCNSYFDKQLSTFALTLYRHTAFIDGSDVQIEIWDTAGQECFQSLHPSYYFGAHACILVFDVTRKITYQHLKQWYVEMRSACPNIPCILIANKIDVDIAVTRQRFKFAEVYKLPFYFVSAADGTNVVQIFDDVMKLAQQFKANPPDSFENDIMSLLDEDDWLTG